jgi:hypothetical protein
MFWPIRPPSSDTYNYNNSFNYTMDPLQTPYIPQSKSHTHILLLGSLIQRICPGSRLFRGFETNLFFMVRGC